MTTRDIRTMLENLLSWMGFTYDDIEERFDPVIGSTILNVVSEDAKHLIGRNGDVVRSISYLVRKMAERQIEEGQAIPNVSIDIDDYAKSQLERLEQKVYVLTSRVRSLGAPVAMKPMSSYERLYVHSIVAKMEDIETESEGEGMERHIVLKFKK